MTVRALNKFTAVEGAHQGSQRQFASQLFFLLSPLFFNSLGFTASRPWNLPPVYLDIE